MSFKINDLIDLNKVPMKILILLAVVSGIFVFSSNSFLKILKMQEFHNDYGKFFGPVFIFTIAFIALSIIYYFKEKIEEKLNVNSSNKFILDVLESLDSFEQSVLREFSIQQKNSVNMPIDNSTVAGLINKRILKRVSNIGDGLFFPLSITKIAEDKLKETHFGIQKGMTEDESRELLFKSPEWAKDYFYQQNNK